MIFTSEFALRREFWRGFAVRTWALAEKVQSFALTSLERQLIQNATAGRGIGAPLASNAFR